MKNATVLLLTSIVFAMIAGIVGYYLWQEYSRDRVSLKRIMEARGQAVLASLEAGIRSHRRMERWFFANINTVLEETAASPGIRGIAVYDEQGKPLGRSGPDAPKWTDSLTTHALHTCWENGELTLFHYVTIMRSDSEAGPPPFAGGWGMRRREALESPEISLPLSAWLVIGLDCSELKSALSAARRRFVFSIGSSLAAVLLGLALTALIQRQSMTAAELGLSIERVKRMEERANLGAGLAHETKNPLSLIRGLAQTLARGDHGPEGAASDTSARAMESDRCGQMIVDEVDRVVGRINSFLEYARAQAPHRIPVALDQIIQETVALFQDEARAKGVALQTQAPACLVMADAAMMRQIIVNLVANALAACGNGCSIEVSLSGGEREIALAVSDTGAGIASEDLPHVVKPYFTRREGGSGLGLAIVDQIAQAHGWRLEIESELGKGATARIAGIRKLN
ncbi:MAG: ATP-binding protein [Candidatus Sumerlaeota bacterium]|nr:ATP-binding protein [Candidatus Sumerlaeota bacterium]